MRVVVMRDSTYADGVAEEESGLGAVARCLFTRRAAVF